MSLFSCKDTVRLASESLDHDLTLRQRVALRLHLLLCPPCACFQRHLLFLREAVRRLEDQTAPDNVAQAGLSAEAAENMKRALEQHSS